MNGVVFTDVDESSNQVSIGVTDESSVENVQSLAKALRIPTGAVRIEVTDPIRSLSTLQDFVRPMEGGLKITSTKFCTLGFFADRSGQSTFITNSHCTNVTGGVEGTLFAQPDNTFGTIGTEIADPSYSAIPNCPPSRLCRLSDSAAVSLNTTSFNLGEVFKTSFSGQSSGSTTINGSFKISTETSFPFVGLTLSKIGMVTGWTKGQVNGTCLDVQQFDTGYIILCQDRVNAGVSGGDSGAAVIRETNGPASPLATDSWAILYGIAWGGGSNFVFSNISQIEAELGALTTEIGP